MYTLYEFHIDPVAKERPRFSVRGGIPRAYTKAKTRNYERDLACIASLQQKGKPPLEGSIIILVTFYLKRPKTVKRKYPDVKPDIDNYCKALCDSLNGIVWKDDSQIIDLFASKRYSEADAYIRMEVTELT